jgi:diaminopimelate decarboxylase
MPRRLAQQPPPHADPAAAADPGLGGAGHVYPIGSRLNEAGTLEVGGCDVVELARTFGTPAYVYAEDDMRARARQFLAAFRARAERFEVVYASKAFPCTAALRLMAEEGLACDVASGGELHMALRGGFAPERIYMHGNNKTEAEISLALERGVGYIVADSFDELDRLERLAESRRQEVMLRVTPGIQPTTHSYVQTGQIDSKFGFGVDEVPRAVERCETSEALELVGLHAHIGSQIVELEAYEKLAELLAGMGDYPRVNLGGGLAIAYTAEDAPPPIDDYVEALLSRAPEHTTVLCEPGRSLVGNAGVTIYTVGTVKEIPGVRIYVAVDGGMSDNLRPMLYDARYEAEIADRFGGEAICTIAGMHCESGDILVRDVLLDEPRPGDVLVVPATGAYGHAMANNYNAVPRPPVIFCSGGDAREVVRRETYEDLTVRDV